MELKEAGDLLTNGFFSTQEVVMQSKRGKEAVG
jgi:hypothetical protein